MVLVDSDELCDPRVFIRGQAGAPGERVPRQFLRVLAGENRRPFSDGSGRLDLARAVTDPANPLTARVLVNRVWMHHFGEPLVATPSDFGARSQPPSHPELLDWLAATFVESGWSLKRLHRTIVLSQTWQQASRDRPEGRDRDPDNRLLWRTHRRRLDLEAMRDSLLAVAGRLDLTMGGRSVDFTAEPLSGRRTLYGKVDRQDLPGLYRAFDFASPDQSAERRPQTTTPQQALFGMNSPVVREAARGAAAQASERAASLRIDAVTALYQVVMRRDPTIEESRVAQEFIAAVESAPAAGEPSAREQLAHALILTNERMYLD
jgi:hypothetical protein